MHYNFDLDLKDGEVAENLLKDIINGKNGKIEVKRDFKTHETGNLAIEVESRGKPSGIATTEADWWAYYIDKLETAIIVPTNRLRNLCKNPLFHKTMGGDNNTSKLVLIPINYLF